MNKARRQELAKLKQKQRLKNYGLEDDGKQHVFKSTGKPCSCFLCKGERYKREKRKWSDDE